MEQPAVVLRLGGAAGDQGGVMAPFSPSKLPMVAPLGCIFPDMNLTMPERLTGACLGSRWPLDLNFGWHDLLISVWSKPIVMGLKSLHGGLAQMQPDVTSRSWILFLAA